MLWALFYACAVMAMGYYVLRDMADGARELAARNHTVAITMTLGLIGIAVIWPVTVCALVYLRIRFMLRTDNAPVEEAVELARMDVDDLEALDAVDAVDDPGATAAGESCSACGEENITLGSPMLANFHGGSHGGGGTFYPLCDVCFDSFATRLRPRVCYCEECCAKREELPAVAL